MGLTEKEQRFVRIALRFLRFRVGNETDGHGAPSVHDLVEGVRLDPKCVDDRRPAYGIARLTEVTLDELLSGSVLSPRTCPHCG